MKFKVKENAVEEAERKIKEAEGNPLPTFEEMKANNPRRYDVAGLGNRGITDGLVYENWEERIFSVEEISRISGISSAFGLDFGYTNDPTALFCGFIDTYTKTLWVFDELYEKALTNEAIAEKIKKKGYSKERITADSAEPKSIDRLRELGLRNIRAARKGRDSIKSGIDYIQGYKIIIHSKCFNFIKEIGNYTWDKDKNGNSINKPVDEFNHLMDAMRYALEGYSVGKAFSFE